jgi:predicted transcriptional regulator
MPDPTRPEPTPGELELLRVLWRRGPSTVRQVLGDLPGAATTGYTTVLKLLQIMHRKGLVARDESGRSHVYAPAVSRSETQRQMLGSLLDRAFDGSAAQLAMQALATEAASDEDLAQVREYLDRVERERGTGGRR